MAASRRVAHPVRSPYPAFETGEAFSELAALIQSDRPPIALIGAGASVQSGYPTWPELLKDLQAAAGKKARAAQWKKNLDDINDAPWTAEVFARSCAPGAVTRLLRRKFSWPRSLAEPHRSLARMRFPHFLTTNFDPCIEKALKEARRKHTAVSWHDTGALSNFLINLSNRRDRTRVVYLHGRFDDKEDDIVLTESSYVARYIASDDARHKLMAIFMTHPVVFVGFSMNDPDLANLMRQVTARLKAKTPCHYAIMSYRTESERETTRDRMEGKFGVRPVFFSRTPSVPGGDDYSNLVPLLEALAARSLARKPKTKKSAAQLQPAEFDPEDPHKGRFGGLSLRKGRRITVKRTGGSRANGRLKLTLTVESLPGRRPITSDVRFYLHPTFDRPVRTYAAQNGAARCEILSYGAFTVGVAIPDEKLSLEIDLAALSHLPLWFRRQ